MLHSIKKEISNVSSSNSFLMLINVKMPTIVSIFNILSMIYHELCMKKFNNLRAGYVRGIRENSTFQSHLNLPIVLDRY